MLYHRILTIQDISCVGQCSLTVALPIISACKIETCILPSAVLSTHTAGFKGYTFRDLTDDMPKICNHWENENIKFDAIYTGYLGSTKQIEYVERIISSTKKENAPCIIDPAMADNGRLYPGFDADFVSAMKKLCARADYIIPNITEACLLCDMEYPEKYDRSYIDVLLNRLTSLGCHNIILTGISFNSGKTGVVVYSNGDFLYYEHEKLENSCHGTGDIYSSVFTGALINGHTPYDSAVIAADFTVECIKATAEVDGHWYGAVFEPILYKLIEKM